MEPGTIIRFCILSSDDPVNAEESPVVIDTIEHELGPSTVIRMGRFTNGRKEGNLHLNAKTVSRRHAKINVKNNKLYIKDTQSSTGTYINGIRLSRKGQKSAPHRLREGDILQLGKDFHGGISERHRKVMIRIEIDLPSQRMAT